MSGLTAIVKDIKGDKVIWMIALILCIASIMAVYSATSSMVYQQVGGNSEKYLLQQLMFIGLGAVVTYLCYRFHYMLYAKLSFIIICVTVLALFYTKFFGIDINGATRMDRNSMDRQNDPNFRSGENWFDHLPFSLTCKETRSD